MAPSEAVLTWVVDGRLVNMKSGRILNVPLTLGRATTVELTVSMAGGTATDALVMVLNAVASWDATGGKVLRTPGSIASIPTRAACTSGRMDALTASIGGCFTGQESIEWSVAQGYIMPSYAPGEDAPMGAPLWEEGVAIFDPPSGNKPVFIRPGPWAAIRAAGFDSAGVLWAENDGWEDDSPDPAELPFAELRWQAEEGTYMFQAWVKEGDSIIGLHDSLPFVTCDDGEFSIEVKVLTDKDIAAILGSID